MVRNLKIKNVIEAAMQIYKTLLVSMKKTTLATSNYNAPQTIRAGVYG